MIIIINNKQEEFLLEIFIIAMTNLNTIYNYISQVMTSENNNSGGITPALKTYLKIAIDLIYEILKWKFVQPNNIQSLKKYLTQLNSSNRNNEIEDDDNDVTLSIPERWKDTIFQSISVLIKFQILTKGDVSYFQSFSDCLVQIICVDRSIFHSEDEKTMFLSLFVSHFVSFLPFLFVSSLLLISNLYLN